MAYVCKTFYTSYYDMLKHLPKPKKREWKKRKEMLVLYRRKCFHMMTNKKSTHWSNSWCIVFMFLKANKSIFFFFPNSPFRFSLSAGFIWIGWCIWNEQKEKHILKTSHQNGILTAKIIKRKLYCQYRRRLYIYIFLGFMSL